MARTEQFHQSATMPGSIHDAATCTESTKEADAASIVPLLRLPTMRRILLTLIGVLFLLAIAMIAWGSIEARRDPVVRRATIAMTGWPAGAPPVRVALLSDIHVAGPDMPPERLARIVAQVNAVQPDLVLIAGDLVSDKRISTHRYSAAEAIAPLERLRARLGVVAVLGNHDHWRDANAFRRALPGANVLLLENRAIRRGPLVIAGIDDDFSHRADLAATLRSANRVAGPVVALTHSPDIAPRLPPRFGLLLAGHTHCGQISLPLIGPLTTMSRHGGRYACGVVREGPRTVVIGAGLGTSILPLRIGVPPDFWILTLGPAAG